MGSGSEVEVLAPYMEASAITGYWIPLEGPHMLFQPADYIYLYGPTIGAAFYLQPVSYGSTEMEVTGITGSAFFGDVYFCGFPVRMGDYADELLDLIEEGAWECDIEVRYSENREFITSLTDIEGQMKLYISNNMVDQVFAWLR
jgi:hypothetical protein